MTPQFVSYMKAKLDLQDIAAEMAEWAAVKALDIAMRRRIAGYEDMPLYSRIQLGCA